MVSKNPIKEKVPSIKGNLKYPKLINTVIVFIETNLLNFRINFDEIDKKDTDIEPSYNNQLSKYFNACLTNETFQFQHEDKKKNKSRPDIGMQIKATVLQGSYKSFFDIECKRLNTSMKHVNQYVYGKTGGIERFKQNLHGADLEDSAIIGYIENETPDFWLQKINYWIEKQIVKNDIFWSNKDKLIKIENQYISNHQKVNNKFIKIIHFWKII